MRILAIILLTTMLAACAAQHGRRYTGPNGRSAYYVECVGAEENCYPEARQLCPTGFRITKLESGLTLSWRDETKLADKFDMLIECND
jgi:hypothetical protein